MKKISLSLLLLLTSVLCRAYYPPVKNFNRETYRAGTQTWAVTQDRGGSMFFANNDGVLRFDGEHWTLMHLNNRTSARSLYYDSGEDCLYVGGTNELGRIDFTPKGLVYTSLLDTLGIYLNEIWSIDKTPEGYLRFADNSTRYTLRGGELLREAFSREKLTGKVFCSAENGEYMAEGTTGEGILLTSRKTGEVVNLTAKNGLQNNSILCLYFDRSGGLWAGTDHGIDYIMLDYPVYNLFGDNGNFGGGYATCQGGGYLYLGTNIGLFRVAQDRLGLSLSDDDFERVAGIDGQVWGLSWTGKEVVACCDRGVYVVEDGRVTESFATDGAWKVEPLDGSPERLLGCSYTRFFVLERRAGSWRFAGWVGGFDESGKSFRQDADGSIWFAHHVKGLYRLTLSDDGRSFTGVEKFGAAQGFPTDRGNYPDEYHGQTVFYTEGGFYMFDGLTNSAYPLDELNDRFDRTVNSLSVFETPQGNMRYYSSGSIQAIEYKTDTGSVIDSLSLQPLLGHRPVGFECIGSLSESELLLNTDTGFVVADLRRLGSSTDRQAGSVFISGLICEAAADPVFSAAAPIEEKGVFRLPYKHNSVGFKYIEPVFGSYSSTEYSSMLRGYDKQFSPFAPESSRRYTGLPAGHYTFIVRAHNVIYGNTVTTDSIDFVIERPWAASMAAIALYVLAFVGLVLLLIVLLSRMTRRKAAQLAAVEAEKMRQAQIRKDLQRKADDLAASTMSLQRKNELFQQISSKLDDAIELAKRGDSSEKCVRRLREISELIRENIAHENDWQKFQDNFDLVYDDFLRRLGEQFPALSQNDKRICAYLRMGLSSKDIAPLLGMTVRSVEMTRYRIRQKLGFSREDNLTDFLQRY